MSVRAVITAGGTREPIDDVRVVANSSTGRFGVELAWALHHRGVEVTLIGAASMAVDDLPPEIRFVPYTSFLDLQRALDAALDPAPDPSVRSLPLAPPSGPHPEAANRAPAAPRCDLILMAAAVADYSPIPTAGKIRSDAPGLTVELRRNDKLLPTLRARCPNARIVGFKLLSQVSVDDLVEVARRQRRDAALTWTVANRLEDLRGDRHPVWLVGDEVTPLDGPRHRVAERLAATFLDGLIDAPPADVPAASGRVQGWWHLPDALAAGPAVDRDGLAAALIDPARDPHRPLTLAAPGGGAWLGGAPLDRARAGARAILADGHLLGHAEPDGDGLRLHRIADGWRWTTARALLDRPLWVRADQAAGWTDAGWQLADGAEWRPATPPWRRTDTRPAASLCLLDMVRRTVLIGQRRRYPVGRWAFPGGRLDPGETPWEAAVRETVEEAAIEVDPDATPIGTSEEWVNTAPCWHITAFIVPVASGPTPSPTDELDAHWVPVGRALRMDLTGGTRRVLERLRRQGW